MTKQNRNKLCLNGHSYTIQYSLKTKIRWRCAKRGLLLCPRVLKTDLNFEYPEVLINHNHSANFLEVFRTKLLS